MLTRGYHTLEDRDNVDKIEESGPRLCDHKNAWLGHGYYFWDTDMYWAHDWGKSYTEYVIFEAGILIDENTFDLVGNIAHKKEVQALINEVLKKGNFASEQTVTIAKVIEYIKKHIGFPYNSIRAADYPSKALKISFGGKRGEYTYVGERVQICLVTKKNLTSGTFRAIFPEKYVI